MYPDFFHLLKDWFGIEIPFLSLLKTFGFLVAMSFLAGGYVIYKELLRKEQDGLIDAIIEEKTIGKPITLTEYLTTFIIGFVVGYKLLGMFLNYQEATSDPLSYLMSLKGNLLTGLLVGIGSLATKYFSTKKEIAEGIKTKRIKMFPHHRVGDVAVIAAVGGFAGAKIFNAFETWDQFIADPLGSLFSSSGLTFYGGLIVATIALWYYSRKIKLDFRYLCDAAAPALILAYGLGRLGCQVSGDGDWGIYNSAYITNSAGKVELASQPFEKSVEDHHQHVYAHFDRNLPIPHKSFKGPSWLPNWIFAYNYPKNVNNVGEPLPNCKDTYCSVLPLPVFPTPIYEFVMGILIFMILWAIRKRFKTPLSIFSIYLMFNGAERFFIEQIRVNYKYDWGFLKPTQAEIIAVCIFIFGALLYLSRNKIDSLIKANTKSD